MFLGKYTFYIVLSYLFALGSLFWLTIKAKLSFKLAEKKALSAAKEH